MLADERQAALRQINPAEGKLMRTYVPRLAVLDDPTSRAAILQRADACRARLQPVVEEICAADLAAAERYPWHSRAKRGSSTAPDDEGEGEGGGNKAARATSGDAPGAAAREGGDGAEQEGR